MANRMAKARTADPGGGWSNWSGEEHCRPARIACPRDVQEVQDVVLAAARDGLAVRPVGSGHSFTAAAVTDGVMVDVGALDSVLSADPRSGLVRVEAGITIRALSERLAALGLGMENLGDIDEQTLAGALATGTHGTGAGLGNLSTQVRAMQLVTADGCVHELDAGDDLLAARVSVGALGIVTAVTLQTLPAYVLHGVDRTEPLDEVLATLDERNAGARHFEAYVFPYSPLALTRTNTVVADAARPPSAASRWLRQGVVETGLLGLLSETGRAVPAAIPRLNRTVMRLAGTSRRTDRSDRIFASPRHLRFVEMEYALPRAAAVPALRAILGHIEERRLPINFPIEMRFVAGDDALLSPAHGRDSAYLAVHTYRDMPWEGYFHFVESVADAYGGRPHWGKRHFKAAESLAARYPAWDRFAAVRARLDPSGLLANPYLDQVFGPVRASVRA